LTGIKLPHQFLQYCHLRVVLHRVAPSTVHLFTALCLPQPPPWRQELQPICFAQKNRHCCQNSEPTRSLSLSAAW